MAEALEFVKSQTETLSKHLTKEHHKLIERFMAFKDRTDDRLKEVDKIEKNMQEME